MPRVSFLVALFLLIMNTTAVALAGSGWCAAAEICLDPGGDEATNRAEQASNSLTGSQSGDGQTLFTTISTVTRDLRAVVILMVAGGPIMFGNIGVPAWGLTLIFGPAYVIVAADGAHLLIGRDTM